MRKIKDFFVNVKSMCQREYIKTTFIFVLFFVGFSLILFSVDRFPSHDDHFFHIRFAEILRERGFEVFKDFHWLYFSNISQDQTYFIYYNFLFYLVLIPFTFIKPLFLGIKLYGAIFGALSFTLLYYFFSRIRERNAFFWILLIFAITSYDWEMRFLFARPFTLAPILLITLLYFAYRKKYWGIFFLSVAYFYWHTATFFFPLAVVGIYFLFENFYGKRLDWKLIGSVLTGIAVPFLISLFFSPGLFVYMKDVIFRVLYDTITRGGVKLSEGAEIYGTNTFDFMKGHALILALLIIGIVFEVYQYVLAKKEGKVTLEDDFQDEKRPLRGSLFLLSIFFLLGSFLSKRNIDYFIFFSAAYVVIVFNYIISQIEFQKKYIRKSIALGVMILVGYLFIGNFLFLYDRIASSGPYNKIEGAAVWLKENTNKGEVVFNPTWNWFTLLFYYNPDNYYIAGIEPRFLYDYDHQLYWAWWSISNYGLLCLEEKCENIAKQQTFMLKNEDRKKVWYKQEGDKISEYIKSNFKSQYVITSKSFGSLNALMDNNDRFEKVFTDNVYNEFFIYHIK